MTSTTFQGPIRAGGPDTGVASTDTRGFVKMSRGVSLTQGASRQIISLPPNSTLVGIGAVRTSAITGGDDLIDARVNFGTSADADQFGNVVLANGSPAELTKKIKQAKKMLDRAKELYERTKPFVNQKLAKQMTDLQTMLKEDAQEWKIAARMETIRERRMT